MRSTTTRKGGLRPPLERAVPDSVIGTVLWLAWAEFAARSKGFGLYWHQLERHEEKCCMGREGTWCTCIDENVIACF